MYTYISCVGLEDAANSYTMTEVACSFCSKQTLFLIYYYIISVAASVAQTPPALDGRLEGLEKALCVYVHTYICIYRERERYVYIYIYICIMCVYIYIYILCVYIYIYTCIYTQN